MSKQKIASEAMCGAQIGTVWRKVTARNALDVKLSLEEFLDELGFKHKKTIPLWPRANREVERQNKSLLKAMRAKKLKGNHGSKSFRSIFLSTVQHLTPRPAELLYGRTIRTKMPEFEGDEEEQRSGTTDQQTRDQDVEQKKQVAETANKRATESDIAEAEGDKVLLLK